MSITRTSFFRWILQVDSSSSPVLLVGYLKCSNQNIGTRGSEFLGSHDWVPQAWWQAQHWDLSALAILRQNLPITYLVVSFWTLIPGGWGKWQSQQHFCHYWAGQIYPIRCVHLWLWLAIFPQLNEPTVLLFWRRGLRSCKRRMARFGFGRYHRDKRARETQVEKSQS
jgi:hypothetical protein